MTAFASIVLAAQPGLGAKSGVDGAATADGKGVDGAFEALVANLTAPASDAGSTMSDADVAAKIAEPMSAENLLTPDAGQMAAIAMTPFAPTLVAPTSSDESAAETPAVAASSRPVSPPSGLAAEVATETLDATAAAQPAQPAPTAADPAEASPPIPAAPPPAAAAPRSAGEAVASLIGRVLDGARKPEAKSTIADAASAQAALEEIPAEAGIDSPVELAVDATLSPETPVPVEAAVVETPPAPAPAPGRRTARAEAARAETTTLDPVASDLKSGDRPAAAPAAPAAPAAATAGRSDLPTAPAVLADAGAEIELAAPDTAPTAPALQASTEAPVEGAPTRGSPETVARLAADIAQKLEGKTTRFDLQLDPLGLGKVDVSIEINADGRLTASLSFDSSQTAADLRGRAGELRQALEAAGFDLAEGGLSFDMNNPGGSGGREARESLAAWSSRAFDTARSGLEQAEALAVRSPWSRAPSGGVDIRI
jgi:flagellar hook-length control protein FliK